MQTHFLMRPRAVHCPLPHLPQPTMKTTAKILGLDGYRGLMGAQCNKDVQHSSTFSSMQQTTSNQVLFHLMATKTQALTSASLMPQSNFFKQSSPKLSYRASLDKLDLLPPNDYICLQSPNFRLMPTVQLFVYRIFPYFLLM